MLLQGERSQIILSTLKKTGVVRVDELAKTLGASENSIRRDLKRLEERRIVERIHGGAVLVDQHNDQIVPFNRRSRIHPDQKLAIARAAVALVRPNTTITIDAGSTAYALAERINEEVSFPLTIITNSLDTSTMFALNTHFEVLVCGGAVSESPRSLVGPYAESFFGRIHADVLFLGASGLSVRTGLTNSNMDEVGVKQAMIGSARRTIALLDSSKIGHVATYPIAALDSIDTLVTDSGVTDEAAAEIERRGVRLIIAECAPQL